MGTRSSLWVRRVSALREPPSLHSPRRGHLIQPGSGRGSALCGFWKVFWGPEGLSHQQRENPSLTGWPTPCSLPSPGCGPLRSQDRATRCPPRQDGPSTWELPGMAAALSPKQSPLFQAQVPGRQDGAVLMQHQGLGTRRRKSGIRGAAPHHAQAPQTNGAAEARLQADPHRHAGARPQARPPGPRKAPETRSAEQHQA